MRTSRRLLLFFGGLVAALLVTLALALLPAVQTWVARRVLAAHPEWGASVERLSAGPGGFQLRGARWSGGSLEIRAPEIVTEIDLVRLAFSREVVIRRLRAAELDVRLSEPAKGTPAPVSAGVPAAGPVAEWLAGVLGRVRLPVDAAVEGVDVAGRLHLPGRDRPAAFSVRGGGFASGREGKLALVAEWDGGDPRSGAFATKGELRGRMVDPRSFSDLHLRLESTARGEPFPGGASLVSEFRLARSPQGEGYRLALATPRHAVLEVAGELKPGADRLRGAWKLDLNSTDLAPLALGLALPGFRARGEGGFEVDPAASAPRLDGKVSVELSGLEVVRPELKALGVLTVHADFDAGWRAGVVGVSRLSARIEGRRPIARVDVKQPFTVDPARHEWSPADPAAELARVRLDAVPTAWLKPWGGELTVDGGDWTGEIVATVAGGGLALRTVGEINVGGLSVARGGERWLHGVELAVAGSASTLAGGWQARVDRLNVRSTGQEIASLDARLGRLAGANQPIKAEGALRLNVASVIRQPVMAGRLMVAAGEATVKFGATLGTERQVQADVRLEKLRGGPAGAELPSVAVDLRLEIDAAGRMKFGAPIRLMAGERASEVSLAGEFAPRAGRAGGRIDARVSGGALHVGDGEALAGVLSGAPAAEAKVPAAGGPAAAGVPPWAEWEGKVEIDLAEVIYDAAVRARDVKGRLELDAGKVRLEGLRGSLGSSGRATLSGALAFDAGRPDPFGAEVQVEVREFDPGPWFRVASGGAPATLEGAFTLSSRLRGRAASLGALATAVSGEVLLSSRGGVFRGLPVKVAAGAGGGGRVAGMIAAAGNALGSLTGRKEPPAIAGRAQAVAEFAAGISTIPFDQLSLVITRDAARNLAVREFTLIAPELRLSGTGTLLHRGGEGLFGDSLALELGLRARGRQGDLLRHLGLLEPVVDDLGYASCRLPLRVAGTPARPDCGELAARLTVLAAEKSGVADKAGELLHRIIGSPK